MFSNVCSALRLISIVLFGSGYGLGSFHIGGQGVCARFAQKLQTKFKSYTEVVANTCYDRKYFQLGAIIIQASYNQYCFQQRYAKLSW